MSKEIYISSTPHETRLAIVENDELTEIYYERENEYTLAGSIYNGRVTRVLPGMQSSFVDVGLERDAFLYITDFMEEAADSADFDHGEKPQRAPRLEAPQNGRGESESSGERGGERGSERGGDRGRERNGERGGSPAPERTYVSERNQEQARATPQTDQAQASEGRGEEFGGRGERNERSGRGRGRGRRDRGGNGERGGQDRVAPIAPVEETPAVFSAPVEEETLLVSEEPVGTPEAGQEIGEGAPGADGSRRWRGRRGRRRGRGTGARDGAPQGAGGESIAGESGVSPEAPEASAGRDEYDEEPVFEIDGSAAEEAPVMLAPVAEPVQPTAAPRNDFSGRREQPRRDGRGGREERGPRGDRGSDRGNDRGDRNAPRAPRGFAPNRSLYGVEAEPEVLDQVETGPAIEPLILPGESLGKYRKEEGGAASPAAPQAAPLTLPANDFKVDPNWDGGSILPGETLSRYRGAASAATQTRGAERSEMRRPQERSEGRREERAGRAERPGRPESEGRGGAGRPEPRREFVQPAEAPMMVPATVPPFDPQSAGPVSGYAHAVEGAQEIETHRPDFTHAPLPEATAEAAHGEEAGHTGIAQIDAAQGTEAALPTEAIQEQPKLEESEEYEPEEASASYRVDPVAPREYRQSAPVVESEAETAPVDAERAGEIVVSGDGDDESHAVLESLHGSSAGAIEAEPEIQTEWVRATHESHEMAHESHDIPPAVHDVTRLDEMGTMQSEPELSAAAVPDETAALVEATPEAAIDEEFDEEGESQHSPQQGFAPGAGDLEEDFLDEEEFDSPTLHAHGGEAFDDLEEEPLEGAADLGTMIRDMSLDQMTGTKGGGLDDEDDLDDFEEDTLEEEMLHEESAAYARTSVENDSQGDSENDGVDETMERYASSGASRDEEEEDGSGKIGLEPDAEGSSSAGNRERGTSSAGSEEDRRGRRDGRRGGRDRDRGRSGSSDRGGSERSSSERGSSDRAGSERTAYDRGGLGERARNTGGGGDRDRGRGNGRGGGRQSMQMTNLPAISELLKPGQEILVQIAKEPIAKKGARITSHIALPGRFLVFMPTVSHTGVSRKIESDAERRRLKEILLSEKGDAAGGFIVRTAAGGASEEELRSDLRFLLNLWNDIKARSESSKSPALIYHDLNLVERILRDQVTDTFSAIWVDTETEYERVLRFLQRFQPALIRRVKLYSKETPLFEQFGITEEINKALRSKVWLKSGGSIVINQTEALVAIDINTGKYVGKTARLEDTIVKTNLDAIPEIVRQIRLRDLGGIIIIDFIDMDERKNRNRVMAALEDELKNDRAPSKILPFNDFGLVAITRKRVKQSLERTLSTPCNVCVGTGMVKSPVTVCNDIYVEMRKMHKHMDRGDVMLRVHPEVVKQLKSTGSKWLQEMEEMCGKTILIKSDPALHPEQFDIH